MGQEILSGQCESPEQDNGQFVRLVWLIEAARNGKSCTMNELIDHARKFFAIEKIQFREPERFAIDALNSHIEKVKTKTT